MATMSTTATTRTAPLPCSPTRCHTDGLTVGSGTGASKAMFSTVTWSPRCVSMPSEAATSFCNFCIAAGSRGLRFVDTVPSWAALDTCSSSTSTATETLATSPLGRMECVTVLVTS